MRRALHLLLSLSLVCYMKASDRALRSRIERSVGCAGFTRFSASTTPYTMPCLPSAQLRLGHFCDNTNFRRDACEVFSGVLEVVVPNANPSATLQSVFVRVYKTTHEHFAVLYPVRALVTACKALTSINLKSCTLDQPSPGQFRVSQRSLDGVSLAFRSPDDGGLPVEDWMAAFGARTKPIPRKNSPMTLPVLLERVEEEPVS